MSCKSDDAVSAIVGEMLMLTLVLILMTVFAATASSFLPPARDPSVTVLLPSGIPVAIYHKGGDAIPLSEIRVMINEAELDRYTWTLYDIKGEQIIARDGLFDLGGYISIVGGSATKGDRIKLATSRSVIFTGVIP